MHLAAEEFLYRQHRREVRPEAEVHHRSLRQVIQMMAHGYEADPLLLSLLEKDPPPVPRAEIAVEAALEGLWVLGL